jgi:RHS repeat-associated protein
VKRCTYAMAWTQVWAPSGKQIDPLYRGWTGSLLQDKREPNGLLYRRNRYLDPASGRFTQPDPIGLAGGLNSYGYASGDPVSFRDPFGSCPPRDNNLTTCTGFFTVVGAATGALFGGAGGGAGGFFLGGGIGAVPGAGIGGLKGAALGAAVGASIDGVVWFGKQARAVEKASELVDNIAGHIATVGNDPNANDANHHRGEIKGWVDRIAKYASDMKGKTQEEWLRKVADWREQLDRLTPP